MKVTNPPYTNQELVSNIEAYSMYPWGEQLTKEGDEKYLRSFRSDKRGLVYTYQETNDSQPYLYVHVMHYGHDVKELLEEDFIGQDSFYQAKDVTALTERFLGAGDIAYISNITADKSVEISAELKPRLKEMPNIISAVFTDTGAETIVMYTHRATAVHEATLALSEVMYDVEIMPYEINHKSGSFNKNRDIDYLELILIRKKQLSTLS